MDERTKAFLDKNNIGLALLVGSEKMTARLHSLRIVVEEGRWKFLIGFPIHGKPPKEVRVNNCKAVDGPRIARSVCISNRIARHKITLENFWPEENRKVRENDEEVKDVEGDSTREEIGADGGASPEDEYRKKVLES